MAKTLRLLMLLSLFGLVAAPAFAEDPPANEENETTNTQVADANKIYNKLGASVGAGIVLLGLGLGIGRIGGQAVEAMSRQPEVASSIQTAMIIAAALIEGAGLFALIICLVAG